MRSTFVYDLPTRIFHGLFAALFLTSFLIAKTVDDESLDFSYHMLSGLLMGGLVLWRIAWGFVGSKHARFSGFNLNPLHLKEYFLGVLSGSKRRWAGHNPASSWSAIAMFALAIGLSVSGYLMSTGAKETFEDAHELMANMFILTVALHVAGVLLHSLRHQDGIAFSMIDGKKEVSEPSAGIPSSRRFSALLLLILVFTAGALLAKNFNSQSRTLSAFGQTLQLGDSENEHEDTNQSEDDEDDHDD